ncbi:DUF2294 domain-containing protein [Alkalihalophilus lindianensis]|uniref:DUF2294 domain-containing protein n=1 Tax=Alkalihalophilus lindianensis TaxID=1630542 RepID=A0ABU3X899_9BACI|nr:DUF2294 domain-containing protein [Alkalihalophilus lindianensis]MDV2684105.1 DUF2294 domain-containing protein [Alkalihalophilus lindianensis]
MENKTKGGLEAEISKALTQWEKDYLGRGSVSVKTDILRDMIIVNLLGILTPAEYSLCESKEGMLSIKRLRAHLIESGKDGLMEIVLRITGEQVKSFHTDISTTTGERVMVFKLFGNFEKKLMGKDL